MGRTKKWLGTVQVSVILLGVGASVVTIASFVITHDSIGGLSSLERDNPIAQALLGFIPPNNQQQQSPGPPLNFDLIYPAEEPLPNPPLADGHDTFSACLLVMDDNHRLTEWLAYHYHVLPLRYIVVTADPRSKTSPNRILNEWRQRGVTIVQWKDRDFWKPTLQLLPIPENATLQIKRDRHRGRQKYFYRKCLIHMQHQNRSWVTLHDTDEYLVYNHAGGDLYAAWQKKMAARHAKSKFHTNKRVPPSVVPPPSTAEEGAMILYIRQEQAAGLQFYQSPCIGIPRLQFGAVESTPEQVTKSVPNDLLQEPEDSESSWMHQLDTLRWRKHAHRNDFVKNALGKVIIDVSRVDMHKTPQFMSLHRPIKRICPAPWHNDWDSGLRINHYLGSWKSYSFRDDARRGFERSREQWEYKSQSNAEQDDDNIRPWIGGLAKRHGVQGALQMLRGVGLPAEYYRHLKQQTNDPKWNLLPDKLEKILSTNVTVTNDGKQVAFDAFVRQKYRQQQPVEENNEESDDDDEEKDGNQQR